GDLPGLESAEPGQRVPRAALAAASRADASAPGGARSPPRPDGRSPTGPVDSKVVVARTGRCALFLLILALLVAHGPVSPHPLAATQPGPTVVAVLTPAPHSGSVFRNLDPEYKRAPMLMRARAFVVGATWLASEHRVAPLALATPHPQALRDNSSRATVTWI